MTIVIRGGTLIDGTGRDPLPESVIVVEGNTIAATGWEPEVRWPPEAQIIDARGKTVLPGFIDAHAHLTAYEYGLERRMTTPASLTVLKTVRNLHATLSAGVTTVRDAGGIDLGLKLAAEQGLVPGPRLFISIVPLSQRGGLFDLHLGSGAELDLTNMFGKVTQFCGGVETLRQITRELLLAGADVISITTSGSFHSASGGPAPQFTVDEIEAVIYEAKAAGKRTMTHTDGGAGMRNAARAGIDSVDHGFYLEDEDIELLIDKGTFLVPTLSCNYGILKIAERYPKAEIHDYAVEAAKRLIPDHAKSFRKASEAGVKIAMGTDTFGWYQGENLFELELMVSAGYTPMQAIMAGTRFGAECLGIEDRLGTLEPGKLADILVVNGDPLVDIKMLQDRGNLSLIMKDGKVFKNLMPL